MSRKEIHSKSLSRISKQLTVWLTGKPEEETFSAVTARRVLTLGASLQRNENQERIDSIARAVEFYKENLLKQIKIIDEQQSIEGIKQAIEKHKKIRKTAPVVFIDYLQTIKTADTRKDVRQEIDNNLSELRTLAAKHEIPIFVISSLNRDTYKKNKDRTDKSPEDEKNIGFASFKESGGIEYSTDVLMSLAVQPDSEDKDKGTQGINLRIIKNRMGRKHRKGDASLSLAFHYYFNYFEENERKETQEPHNKKELKFTGGEIVE